jgi:hypothetical protein
MECLNGQQLGVAVHLGHPKVVKAHRQST